jgi:hypothetical protein
MPALKGSGEAEPAAPAHLGEHLDRTPKIGVVCQGDTKRAMSGSVSATG